MRLDRSKNNAYRDGGVWPADVPRTEHQDAPEVSIQLLEYLSKKFPNQLPSQLTMEEVYRVRGQVDVIQHLEALRKAREAT